MLQWDTAWRALRDGAGLHGLRFHDLRHHAEPRIMPSAVIRAQCCKPNSSEIPIALSA
jgi:hypothetical protein